MRKSWSPVWSYQKQLILPTERDFEPARRNCEAEQVLST
jgi:hypothetical protein